MNRSPRRVLLALLGVLCVAVVAPFLVFLRCSNGASGLNSISTNHWELILGDSLTAERGAGVALSPDGSLGIVASLIDPSGPDGIKVYKLGAAHNVLWAKVITTDSVLPGLKARTDRQPLRLNSASADGVGSKILSTVDNGFLIAWELDMQDSWLDVALVKFSQAGDLQWRKTISLPGDNYCLNALVDPNGGYLLAGQSDSRATITHVDDTGHIVWQNSYSDSAGSVFNACVFNGPDSVILVGQDRSRSFVAATHLNGSVYWRTRCDDSIATAATGIAVTDEGGFLMTGVAGFGDGTSQLFVSGVSASGDVRWSKYYDSTGSSAGTVIRRGKDSDFLLIANRTVYPSDYIGTVIVRKIDSLGNIVWDREIAKGGFELRAYDAIQLSDGAWVITGYLRKPAEGTVHLYVVRVNGDGSL